MPDGGIENREAIQKFAGSVTDSSLSSQFSQRIIALGPFCLMADCVAVARCSQPQQFADDHGLGKPVAGIYFYVKD